jgi:hypothetical protein
MVSRKKKTITEITTATIINTGRDPASLSSGGGWALVVLAKGLLHVVDGMVGVSGEITTVGPITLRVLAPLEEDDRFPVGMDADVLNVEAGIGTMVGSVPRIGLEVGLTVVIMLRLPLLAGEDDVTMNIDVGERSDVGSVVRRDMPDKLGREVVNVSNELVGKTMVTDGDGLNGAEKDEAEVEEVDRTDAELALAVGKDEDKDEYAEDGQENDGEDVERVGHLIVVVMVIVMNDVHVEVGRISAFSPAMSSLDSFRHWTPEINLRLEKRPGGRDMKLWYSVLDD